MKKIVFVIIALVVVFLLGFVLLSGKHSGGITTLTPTPTVVTSVSPTSAPTISTTTSNGYCPAYAIQTTLDIGHGAGNVYGTFTLRNLSQQSCKVLGGFIDVSYDSSIKNITISHVGSTQTSDFTLAPNQPVYSQVHYPNGPQCSSATKMVNVQFSYKISPTESISFTDREGNKTEAVQACATPSEKTEIQVWPMSDHPIVQ